MRKKKFITPKSWCIYNNNWLKMHGYPLRRKGVKSCPKDNKGRNLCDLPFC